MNTSPFKHQGCCPPQPNPAAPHPGTPTPAQGLGGHSHPDVAERRLTIPPSPPRRQQDAAEGAPDRVGTCSHCSCPLAMPPRPRNWG